VDFDHAFSQVGGSPHPHACIIFDDLTSYRKIACKYILDGLTKNEKCVMAVDDYTPAMIRDDFTAARENIDHYLEDERLVIFNVQESYAGNGGFDPDQTVKIWQKVSKKAVDGGFDALRVVGEATFSLGSPELADKLIYYENIINQVLFPSYPFKSLCVYNKRLYPPEIIKTAISAHPILFHNDELFLENIYYVPPHIYFKKHKVRDEIEVWLANIKRNDQNIHARKMEIIRTLSQQIAHDFNTLLLPITGMAELLMDELPEDSELYENALEIFNSGQKGRVLVNEILSLGSRTDP
jgi:hypothetical protein